MEIKIERVIKSNDASLVDLRALVGDKLESADFQKFINKDSKDKDLQIQRLFDKTVAVIGTALMIKDKYLKEFNREEEEKGFARKRRVDWENEKSNYKKYTHKIARWGG